MSICTLNIIKKGFNEKNSVLFFNPDIYWRILRDGIPDIEDNDDDGDGIRDREDDDWFIYDEM